MHPGYAKDKLVNSIKIAARLVDQLPKDRLSPETTEGRLGYVHPNNFSGSVEETVIKFLIRDFTVEGLREHEDFLKQLTDQVVAEYPEAGFNFHVEESYRNMKYKLNEQPEVVEYALEAVTRSGLETKRTMIRGGTDGAKLSFEGLLTPNIFTGGQNFHSKLEWISARDMQKAVDVIVNLIKIWIEKSLLV
jgi:tripeptide aminopeptidase